MPLTKDNEMRVLRRIMLDLERLDKPGRRRVLDYLQARFPYEGFIAGTEEVPSGRVLKIADADEAKSEEGQ